MCFNEQKWESVRENWRENKEEMWRLKSEGKGDKGGFYPKGFASCHEN